mgnify:CR=1 FL=1
MEFFDAALTVVAISSGGILAAVIVWDILCEVLK